MCNVRNEHVGRFFRKYEDELAKQRKKDKIILKATLRYPFAVERKERMQKSRIIKQTRLRTQLWYTPGRVLYRLYVAVNRSCCAKYCYFVSVKPNFTAKANGRNTCGSEDNVCHWPGKRCTKLMISGHREEAWIECWITAWKRLFK